MLGSRALTRRTWSAGTWAGGTFTKGASSDTAMRGTWRPMPNRDVQLLESGDRARDPRVLYTTTALQTVEQGAGLTADHVSPDGGTTWYELRADYDGSSDSAMLAPGVNHYRYQCLRVAEADG